MVRDNIRRVKPKAIVVDGASPIKVDNPELITGKRCLIKMAQPSLMRDEDRCRHHCSS